MYTYIIPLVMTYMEYMESSASTVAQYHSPKGFDSPAQKEADKGAREVARLAQLDALPYPEINRRLFVFVLG